VESDFDTVFTKLRELKASALIIAQDVYFNAESASTRLNIEAYPNPAPVILEITAQAAGQPGRGSRLASMRGSSTLLPLICGKRSRSTTRRQISNPGSIFFAQRWMAFGRNGLKRCSLRPQWTS
jgi:hypothetical protein